jgi:hypothetical protein
MWLVRWTKRARQNGPNEDYTQCRTNTRETVAWLQNREAPRFAHLPLFSLSLLLTSLWTLLYLWTKYGYTHYLFFLFFLLEVSLFSCSWSISKLVRAWYMHTLSQCGVKCMMLRNTRKATLKGQGHQRKRGCQRRKIGKGEGNLRVLVLVGFSRCVDRL